jgi:hypothetical protein
MEPSQAPVGEEHAHSICSAGEMSACIEGVRQLEVTTLDQSEHWITVIMDANGPTTKHQLSYGGRRRIRFFVKVDSASSYSWIVAGPGCCTNYA